MIPLSRALDRVLRDCHPLAAASVPIGEARGLVTAEAVIATEFVPPFANTAMDGFAVAAADTKGASDEHPVTLDVVGTVAAGSRGDVAMGSGQAVRIMTGAPIPPGADAVVMVERCRSDGGTSVDVLTEVEPGNHIRPAGDDLRPGDQVLDVGTVLTAGYLGLLAGLGRTEVSVIPRARVGVMSTGDELVDGPGPLEPGQIRDSNRLTLLALLAEMGCDPVDLGRVGDDEDAIAAGIERGVASCDALVTSGGVSMGDFDFVKAVLDRIGDIDWMQVAIKPSKPLAFGTVSGTPVFGLPGNPVSSMVSFELFARPGLRQMMGQPGSGRVTVLAGMPDGFARRPDGKIHFARVRVDLQPDGGFVARSAGGQGSHQLSAMAAATGLAVVPDGDGIAPGGSVRVILMNTPDGPPVRESP